MNIESLSSFLAPWLNSTKARAWYSFRDSYYAYAHRSQTVVPVYELVSPTVLKIFAIQNSEISDIVTVGRTLKQPEADSMRVPMALPAPGDLADGDSESTNEEDSASEADDESNEDEDVTVKSTSTHASVNDTFIRLVNALFAPVDRQEALDRFSAIEFRYGDKVSLQEAMVTYAYLYQKQLENCGDNLPKTRGLITKFLANITHDRLRERCRTFKKKTFPDMVRTAVQQARNLELAERESKAGNESVNDTPYQKVERGTCHDSCLATFEIPKSGCIQPRPVYDVQIGGETLRALYDTGATTNFISEEAARRLSLPIREEKHRVRLLSGQIINSSKAITTTITIPSSTGRSLDFDTDLVVLPDVPEEIIFGFPLLHRTGLIILPEPKNEPPQAEDEEADMLDVDHFNAATDAPDTPSIVNFKPECDNIISRFPHLFDSIKHASKMPEFDLKLSQDRVINVHPYRHSETVEKEIARQVQELLDLDIIEVSDSSYNNPIVMAKKRGGALRLCLDFRAINEVTHKDSHPLPLIDDLLDHLEGQRYFASLDLQKAFHQIIIKPSSRAPTAFTAAGAKYQYKRMPFGLRNAPLHCQRAIESVLGSALYTKALAYIDDVIIFGRSKKEFLVNLEDVLQRLNKFGLRLNAGKSTLAATEVDYLGWRVTGAGRRISPDRLEAIHSLKRPSNISEARSLLGFANYFRALISKYADITEPITALTRVTEVFKWGDEQENAFQEIKKQLLSNTLLHHPRPGSKLHFHSDASDIGVGGMLSDENGRPLVYFSAVLNSTQRRWSTIEKECYALYFGITKCRRYLSGRHFVAHTDHRNLVFIDRSQNQKVVRWRLALNEYDFQLRHVAGSENIIADTFSRLLTSSEVGDQEASRPKKHRQSFEEHHNSHVGHMGSQATLTRLQQAGQSWKGMEKDIIRWISACPVCQLTRRTSKPVQHQLHNTSGAFPFQMIQADAIGPLPTSDEGLKHAIVVVDTFSKLTQAYACRSTSAEDAIVALQAWFRHYGAPSVLVTDNCSQFKNEAMQAFCSNWGTTQRFGTPYHPAGQGVVERRNAEIKRHLRACQLEDGGDWPGHLPTVTAILNNVPYTKSGLSAFQLMFGRDAPSITEATTPHQFRDTLLTLQQHQRDVLGRTPPSKSHVDLVGKAVLLHRPTAMGLRTRGPLRVIKRAPRPNVYIIRDLTTGKDVHAHASSLSEFAGDYTDEQLQEWAARVSHEYVVRDVTGHKCTKGKLLFRVAWEGYDDSEATWEPYTRDLDQLEALGHYLDSHPDAASLVKAAKTPKRRRR